MTATCVRLSFACGWRRWWKGTPGCGRGWLGLWEGGKGGEGWLFCGAGGGKRRDDREEEGTWKKKRAGKLRRRVGGGSEGRGKWRHRCILDSGGGSTSRYRRTRASTQSTAEHVEKRQNKKRKKRSRFEKTPRTSTCTAQLRGRCVQSTYLAPHGLAHSSIQLEATHRPVNRAPVSTPQTRLPCLAQDWL